MYCIDASVSLHLGIFVLASKIFLGLVKLWSPLALLASDSKKSSWRLHIMNCVNFNFENVSPAKHSDT